jgi:hypothetical protein
LPASIVTQVAAHLLSPNDRRALSLVSRAFRAPVQRALFEALHLRTPARTMGAFALLKESPRIANYIDALALFIGDDDDEDDAQPTNGHANGHAKSHVLAPVPEEDDIDDDSDASSVCSSMSEDDGDFVAPPEPPPLPDGFWEVVGEVRFFVRIPVLPLTPVKGPAGSHAPPVFDDLSWARAINCARLHLARYDVFTPLIPL